MGLGPLGLDAQTTTVVPKRTVPIALAFDGSTKDFIKVDGAFLGTHPVDAKMFNVMRIALGSVRSSADTGQSIASLKYLDKNRIASQVEDIVAQATARMRAAGEVTLLGNEIETNPDGRLAVRVNYLNNITGLKESAPGTL